MGTIKKFFIYFLMFIVIFLFVELLKNVGFKNEEKYIFDYKINTDSPTIVVKESKASNTGGHINGFIVNDTDEHIKDKFLQFDFYNSNGEYVGTESKEIKYFNVKEMINYDIYYDYKDVNSVEIDFVDEIVHKDVEKNTFMDEIYKSDDLAIRIGVPIGLALLVYTLLP